MGDGTEQSPYTREDVLRLIEENGGKAEGLDLSGKVFEQGIDLSGLDLTRIILKNVKCFSLPWLRAMLGVYFEEDVLRNINPKEVFSSSAHFEKARLLYAHLEGAELPFSHFEHSDLSRAHLEGADLAFAFLQGASLIDAHLEGARLTGAFLEGTSLGLAHLEGASLGGAKFSDDTKLEGVDWGNYILGEEKNRAFPLATETYRRLKQWYTNAGMYDTAGEFFFREMTARRKSLKWWPNPLPRAWSKFLSLICGYGERPLRVIGWAASVILVSTLIYFIVGSVWQWSAFWNSLYFSAVSFTALGYGSWVLEPTGWVKTLGAFESFIGVFSIALFLVTFVRKMTR